MITTDLLKQFKDSLDICNQQVTALLQQRQKSKLFKDSEDYELSLKACKWYPSEYYKIRLFDEELTLMFNSRKNQFYINLETNNYNFVRKETILEFIQENNLIYKPDISHFNIDNFKVYYPKEYEFENIVKVFLKFSCLFLQLKIGSENLFIYNK